MTQTLKPTSEGVIHSTPGRTRLRLPADYRDHAILKQLELKIQQVAGVKYAETNDRTGSIVIYHEEDPKILQGIGVAIAEENPQLFRLLAAGRPEPQPGSGGKLLSLISNKLSNRDSETVQLHTTKTVKKIVPMAFLVAGVVRLVETESLWAGMAPLVLFYYAFDTYWKFKEEKRTTTILNEEENRRR